MDLADLKHRLHPMIGFLKSPFARNVPPEGKISPSPRLSADEASHPMEAILPSSADAAGPSTRGGLDPDWIISVLLVEQHALQGEVKRLQAETQSLRAENEQLRAALTLQVAKRFGKSSEKRAPQAEATPEPSSPLGVETPAPERPASAPIRRKRGGQPGHAGHGRAIPAGLPREERLHELPENERQCPDCGLPYEELPFTDDSEEVDVQVKVVVLRHRRKCYRKTCACPGPQVLEPPVPSKLIPKSKFTDETWTKFLLDKYLGQVPITRQIELLQHTGLPVAKSTVHGGFDRLYDDLAPLYQHFLTHLHSAGHIQADETRWMVFEEVEGKTNHRWWLWSFASPSPKIVVFVLDPTRSAAVPKRSLGELITPEQVTALADSPLAARIVWVDEKPYLLPPNRSAELTAKPQVHQCRPPARLPRPAPRCLGRVLLGASTP